MTDAMLRTYESLADFAPDWVAVPGESINDLLEERGWTQADLATRTGFTTKHVNLLLKGKAPITEETALKLERVLGSTARFWLNLETQYREHLARQVSIKALSEHTAWLKELPLGDMVKFGWVRKVTDKAQQVFECLRYFGVAEVSAWREQYESPVAAYRAAEKLIRTPAAVSAWLRQGERKAEDMRLAEFDRDKFEVALKLIRGLTTESNPKVFLPKLIELSARVGVAVVLAPAPKGCPVSGATKWLGSTKALIMLSLRGKTDDKLWFSFFHEAGHLLKHGKRMTFLDILGEDGLNPQEEKEADVFARDWLIPQVEYRGLLSQPLIGERKIKEFAKRIGVAPGIVVGRLQYDGQIGWQQFNHLKVRYVWNHESR
ncbi:HigA family addiction module antitoxin [Propionivibrio sp.]|uniref:HigA family addiction module antitoxin n=1 Tax=Propionivibrio sp. TaxID=2212460 RepID=UPI0026044752|nr:HigA family addiction module antitoxin [Propionivibrio sp.]